MKSRFLVFTVLFTLLFSFSTAAVASEQATPKECIEKCQEAARYLSEEMAKGPDAEKTALAYMNQKEDNRFVWKDSYVWVHYPERRMMDVESDI